ncbi:YjcZ family sporulation protein [Bacillus sp. FJAT-49736]|nr:YjcZ family sporulation protein [Bacillus sp. FJAT-49736]MBS4174518.1 YjcZ family sporulation protein [Bacillus sp. FJAT-49736]
MWCRGGYSYGGYSYGGGSSFVLIVVLFILLIIVGTSFVGGGY